MIPNRLPPAQADAASTAALPDSPTRSTSRAFDGFLTQAESERFEAREADDAPQPERDDAPADPHDRRIAHRSKNCGTVLHSGEADLSDESGASAVAGVLAALAAVQTAPPPPTALGHRLPGISSPQPSPPSDGGEGETAELDAVLTDTPLESAGDTPYACAVDELPAEFAMLDVPGACAASEEDPPGETATDSNDSGGSGGSPSGNEEREPKGQGDGPVPPDGMPFAQRVQAMKTPPISNLSADASEQNLPGQPVAQVESAGGLSPIHNARAFAHASSPSVELPAGFVADWNRVHQAATTSVVPISQPVLPGNPMAERIAHLLANETALMRNHRAESLAVVIRPDANTELFLQVRQRDGQIEAMIRCDRGDFSALNAGWHDLQERLARQDIRLSALRSTPEDPRDPRAGEAGEHGTHAHFHAHGHGRRSARDEAEELSMAGSVTEPLRASARPRTRRGSAFESWA